MVKLKDVRRCYLNCEYIEIGIGSDHMCVHMVVLPAYTVSKVVKKIKKNTNKPIMRSFDF
jgi:hypothetical protein